MGLFFKDDYGNFNQTRSKIEQRELLLPTLFCTIYCLYELKIRGSTLKGIISKLKLLLDLKHVCLLSRNNF